MLYTKMLTKTEKIKIGRKEFYIVLLEKKGVEVKGMKITDNWICAYTNLENAEDYTDEELGYPTYRNGETIGVDTAHFWNIGTSIKQKEKDARDQIKISIDCYLNTLKERKKLKKRKKEVIKL